MGATHVANVTDLACRTALACRGVAHVTIPVDIQDHQLDEALAVPGPALVEAVVDPFEPPMPGRVSLDQAAMFARSLVRGEPNRAQIALTAVSNKVRELV
jgi:thiamine pyrophosphate-dependent acetolactate synthase large subunit-like protein